MSTFGGRDATGLSEWHTFTAEGRTFLVLALSWPTTDATIDWAKSVIAANPTLPAISHARPARHPQRRRLRRRGEAPA